MNIFQKLNPFKSKDIINSNNSNVNKNLGIGNISVGRLSDLLDGTCSNSEVKNWENSWVKQAVEIRASNISDCRILLYEQNKNGDEAEITSHPFLEMIKKNNSYDLSFSMMLYNTAEALDTIGKYFFLIIRDSRNNPIEFLPLDSAKVKIQMNQSETLIAGYNYNGKMYSKNDIIAFRIPDSKSPLIKVKPTISSMNRIIEINNYQEIYQRNWFKNSGKIGISLETDKEMSDAEFNKINNALRNQWSQIDEIGRPMVLTGGMKLNNSSNEKSEMSFVDSNAATRRDILAKLRVPESLLGYGGHSSYALAKIQKAFFIENTVKPFANTWIHNPLDSFVKNEFGQNYNIKLEYKNILSEDDLKVYQLLSSTGSITGNELRMALGNFGENEMFAGPVKVSSKTSTDNNSNNDSKDTNNTNND